MSKYTDDIIPGFFEINNRHASPDSQDHIATFMKDRHLHPDGQAWKKPCTKSEEGMIWGWCIFSKPEDRPYFSAWKTPFICTHRQDEGYLRVCAGWHAMNKRGGDNE
jgi:hypothetical protein